jgi:hypothetical protein
MKPKISAWVLYDGSDNFVTTYKSQKLALDGLGSLASQGFTLKAFHYLTAKQASYLRYYEAVSIESMFQLSISSKVSR